MTAWTSREQLGTTVATPASLEGLVLSASSGPSAVSLTSEGWTAAVDLTVATLEAAGIGTGDRVLSALTTEPDGAVVLTAALRRRAGAALGAGPRGRMRLHQRIRSMRPNVLVATPTGAMDLLARLHMEFLIEPEDLGIEHLVLVGEIPNPGTYTQLASEFACRVTELFCDPAYGVALAHRAGQDAALTPIDADLLTLAAVDRDEPAGGGDPALVELVVHPRWAGLDVALRTGWVATTTAGGLPVPGNTVGDLVLVRGRWVSVQALGGLFARIDGIDHWSLEVSREGTLDHATVHVAFGRESLLGNPMWAGRVEEALRQATPVRMGAAIVGTADWSGAPVVDDRRGHHLGCDRSAIA